SRRRALQRKLRLRAAPRRFESVPIRRLARTRQRSLHRYPIQATPVAKQNTRVRSLWPRRSAVEPFPPRLSDTRRLHLAAAAAFERRKRRRTSSVKLKKHRRWHIVAMRYGRR